MEGGNGAGDSSSETKQNEAAQQQHAAAVQIKHDWYQTDSDVVISIFIKKANKDDVSAHFSEKGISATVKLPGSSSEFTLALQLAHSIIPTKCVTKVLGSKIELKLKKVEGLRWNKLEGEDPYASKVATTNTEADTAHEYPSSSHYTRDWDKVAKELEEEEKKVKPEGDAAVNDLFQKIYSDGSEEVKKAMNKSFQESGGTVLSTNWEDIGKKKTDIKPPDGLEYKKYDS